ncbi:hypothetical protein LNP02_21410 [Klebsiella variicola subsp. variicola]|nr:hypothetical protein [Klebsiella variicola subsp. variicola]
MDKGAVEGLEEALFVVLRYDTIQTGFKKIAIKLHGALLMTRSPGRQRRGRVKFVRRAVGKVAVVIREAVF